MSNGAQYAITSQMSAKNTHEIFPSALVQTFDLFCKSLEYRDKLDDEDRAWRRKEEAVRSEAEKYKKLSREQQKEIGDLKLKVMKSESQLKLLEKSNAKKDEKIMDLEENNKLADMCKRMRKGQGMRPLKS